MNWTRVVFAEFEPLLGTPDCLLGVSALRYVVDAQENHLGVIELTRAEQQHLVAGVREVACQLEVPERSSAGELLPAACADPEGLGTAG